MPLKRARAGIAVLVCLATTATADMYTIKNPAEKIDNPAGRIYNPATQVNNPAATIYNPAGRMNDPDPFSPPTPIQAVPVPAVTEALPPARPATKIKDQPRPRPVIPQKDYNLKTAKAYIAAAKKAFVQDDFREFISISEDALRRISAGTLKASRKSKQKLLGYKIFGYGLLEKSEE